MTLFHDKRTLSSLTWNETGSLLGKMGLGTFKKAAQTSAVLFILAPNCGTGCSQPYLPWGFNNWQMAAKGNQAVDACVSMYLSMHVCVCADFSASHIQRGEKKKCALILTSVCVCLYLTSGPCDIATPSPWYCTILSRCHNWVKMPHLECRQNLEMNPTELGRETENVSGQKSREH